MRAHPAPVRDIGNGIIARQIFMLPEPRIEHGEETLRLVLITVDGRLKLLREIAVEDIGLPHHRSDAAHLEHQPLHDERAPLRVPRHQPPGLLREVDEDRARLEHDEVAFVAIDDHGNAAVRIECEEPVLPLLERGEVDHAHAVRQAEFL